MSKRLMLIFGIGVLIALSLALWQYSLAPQGTLLYTPAPGTKPNFTPSSAIGFFVAALGLCTLSLIVSLISFFIGFVANRRWFSFAKQSIILALGFGLLVLLTMVTEKLWP